MSTYRGRERGRTTHLIGNKYFNNTSWNISTEEKEEEEEEEEVEKTMSLSFLKHSNKNRK